MALTFNQSDGIHYGLSTDTPPTNVEPSSKFYEYDTGKLYIFDGTIYRDGNGVAR
jgi:hypothetical protein